MNTNNKTNNLIKDASETVNERKRVNIDSFQNASQNSEANNSFERGSNKATGMSSEAGSDQSKKSWQGIRGGKEDLAVDRENNTDDLNQFIKIHSVLPKSGYTGR